MGTKADGREKKKRRGLPKKKAPSIIWTRLVERDDASSDASECEQKSIPPVSTIDVQIPSYLNPSLKKKKKLTAKERRENKELEALIYGITFPTTDFIKKLEKHLSEIRNDLDKREEYKNILKLIKSKPSTEKPFTEKPSTEKPSTEKQKKKMRKNENKKSAFPPRAEITLNEATDKRNDSPLSSSFKCDSSLGFSSDLASLKDSSESPEIETPRQLRQQQQQQKRKRTRIKKDEMNDDRPLILSPVESSPYSTSQPFSSSPSYSSSASST